MKALLLFQMLAAMPLFASRAFLTALLVAAVARWGTLLPWVGDWDGMTSLAQVPSWFTHDVTLCVLTLLAALEALAIRNSEARELLHDVEPFVKGVAALVVNLGLADALTNEMLRGISAEVRGGDAGGAGIALVAAGGTFVLAQVRAALFRTLADLDVDDAFSVQKWLLRLEGWWVGGSVLLLAVLPILALVASLFAVALAIGMERRAARAEAARRVRCGNCDASVFPAAAACATCGAGRVDVRGISWLGGVAKEPAGPGHREGLLAAGRCPRCAERFRGRECPCGERAFASDEHGAAYLRALDGRFVRLLPVAALCGLLPAVGVVPVLLLVRFGLLSPARRYLPLTTGFVLRWGVRFVNLGLVLVQGLPLLGILALPLLVTVDWAVYRRALRGAIAR